MTEQQSFFTDVINLMPFDSILFVQSPDLESETILRMMRKTEYEYYRSIDLTQENKILLMGQIINNDIQDYIQSIEIKHDNHLLFEGFDGVEFGTISNKIRLPKDFIVKYIEGNVCTISKDW